MQLNFPRCNIGWLRVSIFFAFTRPYRNFHNSFSVWNTSRVQKAFGRKESSSSPNVTLIQFKWNVTVTIRNRNGSGFLTRFPFVAHLNFTELTCHLGPAHSWTSTARKKTFPTSAPEALKCVQNTFLFVRVTLLLPPRSELATIAPSLITQKTLLQLPLLLTH